MTNVGGGADHPLQRSCLVLTVMNNLVDWGLASQSGYDDVAGWDCGSF